MLCSRLAALVVLLTISAVQAGTVAAEAPPAAGGEVRPVTMPLGFAIRTLAVSTSGRWAVASDARTDGTGEPKERSQLVLIDLEKQAQAASVTLAPALMSVAVDDRYVYVNLRKTDTVDALSLQDLSRQKQITVERPVLRMCGAAGGLLALWVEAEPVNVAGRALRVNKPDMAIYKVPEFVPATPRYDPRPFNRQDTPFLVPLMGGWWNRCVLYRSDLAGVQLISRPALYLSANISRDLPAAVARSLDDHLTPWDVPPKPWGCVAAVPEAYANTVLGDLPIAVAITFLRGEPGMISGDLRLGLHEIDRGRLVRQFDLPVGKAPNGTLIGERPLIQAAGRSLAVSWCGALYCYRFSDDALKSYPEPLHFVLPTEVPLIQGGKRAALDHQVIGGTAPYAFSFVDDPVGLAIDVKTGRVTLDGPAVSQALANCLAHFKPDTALTQIPNLLDDYRYFGLTNLSDADFGRQFKTECERLEKHTGIKVQGAPRLIPLHLKVTDAEGREATLTYYAVVDVPPAQILTSMKAVRKAAGK